MSIYRIGLALCLVAGGPALAAGKLRFWNETAATIVELYLAPAGTTRWSANQCDNDPDKSVDADERLDLAGIEPGRYDVKLKDKTGRHCLVRNVEVKGEGKFAFAIAEEDLRDCEK